MDFLLYSYSVGETWFSSRPRAEQFARQHGGVIVEHSQMYRVGDLVEVLAYRAWRLGRVVEWNRRRVWVKFHAPEFGERELRSFSSIEIRPRLSDPTACAWVDLGQLKG